MEEVKVVGQKIKFYILNYLEQQNYQIKFSNFFMFFFWKILERMQNNFILCNSVKQISKNSKEIFPEPNNLGS